MQNDSSVSQAGRAQLVENVDVGIRHTRSADIAPDGRLVYFGYRDEEAAVTVLKYGHSG